MKGPYGQAGLRLGTTGLLPRGIPISGSGGKKE